MSLDECVKVFKIECAVQEYFGPDERHEWANYGSSAPIPDLVREYFKKDQKDRTVTIENSDMKYSLSFDKAPEEPKVVPEPVVQTLVAAPTAEETYLQMTVPEDVVSTMNRLSNCDTEVRFLYTGGGGNCMYHALIICAHLEMDQMVLRHRLYNSRWSKYFSGRTLDNLLTDGEWGDDDVLRLFVLEFPQFVVCIHNYDKNNILTHTRFGQEGKNKKVLHLRLASNHFSASQVTGGMNPEFLSPPLK